MKHLLVILILTITSCGSIKSDLKPIENGEIACLKAEAAAVEKKVSVVQIAVDAVQAVATALAGDPGAAIDQLIAKYAPQLGQAAEATVACAVNVIATGGGTADKPKGSANALAAQQVIAKHGWRFKQ